MTKNPLVAALVFAGAVYITVKGGDWFVDAASWIAESFGIPKLIVGATVVSFATTLPEMLVSSFAAADAHRTGIVDTVDMAIGNAVGSVTANIGLIMAIALIAMPMAVKRKDYLSKSLLMLGAAATVASIGVAFGNFPVWGSIFLLLFFILAMWENISIAVSEMKFSRQSEERAEKSGAEIRKNIILFILGAAAIVVGAELLKDSGKSIAEAMGIEQRIIGITIVAIGTSLPELVTTVISIAKKQFSMSVGNIIGANIIDLALILPISSLVYGNVLPVQSAVYIDLVACLAVGLVALVPTLISGKFSRWQGFTLLTVYSGYLAYSCFFNG